MIGRFWEDDATWLGEFVDDSPPSRSCASVPCPSFENVTLDVVSLLCLFCGDPFPKEDDHNLCPRHRGMVRAAP